MERLQRRLLQAVATGRRHVASDPSNPLAMGVSRAAFAAALPVLAMGAMRDNQPVPSAKLQAATANAREHYERNGWWIAPDLLSVDAIHRANTGAKKHLAGERDAQLPAQVQPLLQDVTSDDPTELQVFTHIALLNWDIRALLADSRLGAMASQLSGHAALRLFSSALVYKPPRETGATRIGWHADMAYFKTCSCQQMVTAWVPLQDTDARMGGPVLLSRSHRIQRPRDSEHARRSFLNGDAEATLDVLGDDTVSPSLRRGDVLFLHAGLMHTSGPNRRELPRWAAVFFLQSGDNHYRVAHEDDGSLATHLNDRLCRRRPDGLPDYADPRYCPAVWPREGS